MIAEDRVCYNCRKRWGEHYGNFCQRKDRVLRAERGIIVARAKTFIHNGMYQTRDGRFINDTTDNDPNFLFRRRKQHDDA